MLILNTFIKYLVYVYTCSDTRRGSSAYININKIFNKSICIYNKIFIKAVEPANYIYIYIKAIFNIYDAR